MADKTTVTNRSIARMAGNIAAGMIYWNISDEGLDEIAAISVELARRILAEIENPNPLAAHLGGTPE